MGAGPPFGAHPQPHYQVTSWALGVGLSTKSAWCFLPLAYRTREWGLIGDNTDLVKPTLRHAFKTDIARYRSKKSTYPSLSQSISGVYLLPRLTSGPRLLIGRAYAA